MLTSVIIINVIILLSILYFSRADNELPDVRPPIINRTFNSVIINKLITQLQSLFIDKNISILFSNCFPNTLDTTIYYHSNITEDLDTFVITGDITALWLRDSMNQVLPYLPYTKSDEHLLLLIEGLINRQASSILIDSYANAFNYNASHDGHQDDIRKPPMTPAVFEGKYEIDSVLAFLKLSYWHYYYAGNDALLRFANENWLSAVSETITTIRTMQESDGSERDPPYLFQRLTTVATDTLMMSGRGPPAHLTGLSRSLFRPSDDSVMLPYNIPGNAMACVELTHTVDMLQTLNSLTSSDPIKDTTLELLTSTNSVRKEICEALDRYLTVAKKDSKPLPFEIDGIKSEYYMDDANLPSLLSLPALGYISSNNEVYTTTREFVLSEQNPFYFKGVAGSGIGGPHEGYNYSWPMAIIMQAITSDNDEEISWCLDMLVKSSAGTGLLHESFDVNDVNIYTRDWFAWVNGMFGELILQLITTKPHLVIVDDPDAIALAQSLVQPTVSLLAQQNTIIN